MTAAFPRWLRPATGKPFALFQWTAFGRALLPRTSLHRQADGNVLDGALEPGLEQRPELRALSDVCLDLCSVQVDGAHDPRAVDL